jgi:hypothetical protein
LSKLIFNPDILLKHRLMNLRFRNSKIYPKHGSQTVHYEVRQNGRKGVSVTHCSGITKERPDIAINVGHYLASHDQLHQAVNNHSRKNP